MDKNNTKLSDDTLMWLRIMSYLEHMSRYMHKTYRYKITVNEEITKEELERIIRRLNNDLKIITHNG